MTDGPFIAGRISERADLPGAFASGRTELIAVCGRRRVGAALRRTQSDGWMRVSG
jgi:hypothetical protein